MWTGNYLTIDQFMAELHDRFRFVEQELDKTRVKEWLYKAMGLIGVLSIYPNLNTEIQLVKDEDIKYSYATMPAGVINIRGVIDENKVSLIYASALVGWDDQSTPPSYQINGSVILTNLCSDGMLTINYDSFPVNESGDPLIPDEVVYIEAMLAYIGYRIGYELWMSDRLSGPKYQYLEQEWLFYVNSAKTKMLMPGLDQYQSLANQLNRINQSPLQHASKFKYLNTP